MRTGGGASASEAEDAVQEAWLKLSRSDTGAVENLGGWLTTIVARVCLDMLRSRASRREEPLATVADAPSDGNPEHDVTLADATGPALLIILEMLGPAERVAFVRRLRTTGRGAVPRRCAAGG